MSVRRETVSLASSHPLGGMLHAVCLTPPRVNAVCVFFHGLGMHSGACRYSLLYDKLASRGLAVVAWDCPHHGKSSSLGGGKDHPLRPLLVREPVVVADAVELVHEARQRFPFLPLVLVGESMGGGVALRIASLVRPSGVCTLCGLVPVPAFRLGVWWGGMVVGSVLLLRAAMRAPRSDVQSLWKDEMVPKRVAGVSAVRCHFRLVRNTEYDRIECPLLAVVGGRDPLYGPRDTLRMLEACTGVHPLQRTLHTVHAASHSLVVDEEAVDACAEFAAQCAARV